MWLLPALLAAAAIWMLVAMLRMFAWTASVQAEIAGPPSDSKASALSAITDHPPSMWLMFAPPIIAAVVTLVLYTGFIIKFWLRLNRASIAR